METFHACMETFHACMEVQIFIKFPKKRHFLLKVLEKFKKCLFFGKKVSKNGNLCYNS
jgi:hypothetical protein